MSHRKQLYHLQDSNSLLQAQGAGAPPTLLRELGTQNLHVSKLFAPHMLAKGGAGIWELILNLYKYQCGMQQHLKRNYIPDFQPKKIIWGTPIFS